MNKIIGKIKHAKTLVMTAIVALVLSVGQASFAAGEAGTLDGVADNVKTQMGSIQSIALIVLGSVAGVAIVLFGAIYAWRYGKKVFAIISK